MNNVLEFRTKVDRVQPKRTLEAHGFIAEFFVNEKTEAPVYHYVVMKKGSVEILGWGQERTFESAERMATNCMEMLSQRTTQAV